MSAVGPIRMLFVCLKALKVPLNAIGWIIILPQGYLNGFTNPDNDGQIYVFDCRRQQWFDSGAAGAAATRGFYDYLEGIEHDQTADQAKGRCG